MSKARQRHFWVSLIILVMVVLCLPSIVFSRSKLPWGDRKASVNEKASTVEKTNLQNAGSSHFINPIQQKIGSFPVSTDILLQGNYLLPHDDSVSLAQVCRDTFRRGTDLESRLEYCPTLKEAMVWETGSGERHPYTEWTEEQKARLEYFFQALLRGDTNLGIHCPDLSIETNYAEPLHLFLTMEQAFDIYAARVAHALYLEATHRVAWSLVDLPPEEKAVILASYHYHTRILPAPWIGSLPIYRVFQPNRDFQTPAREYRAESLLCDPRIGYSFLRGSTSTLHQDLLAGTEEETLQNITWWFYNNVSHGFGFETLTSEQWIQRFVNFQDRLRRQMPSSGATVRSIVAPTGCHSAANLMLDLARSINIPLLVISTFDEEPTVTIENPYGLANPSHLGLVFRWARSHPLVLQHADDIYTSLRPIFPLHEDGSPAPSEASRQLFEVNWVSPETLSSWGFNYLTDLPLVRPGIGYGLYSSTETTYPDFGYVGGFWLRAGPPRPGSTSSDYRLRNSYLYEKQYRLCSWSSFIERYCDTTDTDHAELMNLLIYSRGELPLMGSTFRLPISRTSDDFFHRAEECVAAYGGCDAIRASYQNWLRNFGSNTLGDF